MKIKEALDTQSNTIRPIYLMVATMQKLHLEQGYEQAQALIYGVAIEVAKQSDCYFELDGNNDQNKEVFYFWSKSLGDKKPDVFNN